MRVKPNKQKYPHDPNTEKKLKLILKDISEGATIKLACKANYLCPSHFHALIRQGECDLNENIFDTLPVELAHSLASIQMNEIKECRKLIKTSEKGHRGAEWTLEQSYWRDFSSNAQIKELAEEIENLRKIGNRNE